MKVDLDLPVPRGESGVVCGCFGEVLTSVFLVRLQAMV